MQHYMYCSICSMQNNSYWKYAKWNTVKICFLFKKKNFGKKKKSVNLDIFHHVHLVLHDQVGGKHPVWRGTNKTWLTYWLTECSSIDGCHMAIHYNRDNINNPKLFLWWDYYSLSSQRKKTGRCQKHIGQNISDIILLVCW